MAEQVMDARSRAASGDALIEAERHLSAPLRAPHLPGEGRPGGNLLRTIEARHTGDGSQ
jgi:hypothetical protein